ncbi:hypothetical protein E0L36_09940 [Streptomyces sp. AJS327]|uniref:ATP-grasp domain-containing protein n=1 Tax=Streptomyces sp. AJS327 TaxID=2545265 RepID=UPI0015DF6DE7|nr:hypothetical protein [Streptomyces sp. AJS327]MBA0051203.1 hypothetical protein [Streptomyces sp. AJS327]
MRDGAARAAGARQAVGVVYDLGAAGPAELAAAARTCGAELFLVVDAASEHVRRLLPVLRKRFALCEVTGLGEDRAAAAVAAFAPGGLLTFSEHRMEATAALAATLGLRHWHSPEVTRRLVDKLEQRRSLAAAGLDGPPFAVARTPGELPGALGAVGLPAVLKPRRGTGSRLVRRVDGAAEARAAAAEFFAAAPGTDLLVEGFLAGDAAGAGREWGDYVSVETAVHEGVCHPLCVAGKFPLVRPFRERGSFVPHTLDPALAARARALAEAAIAALGVRDGVVHTELKLTRDGPRLIEVNGRLGGLIGAIVRRGSGVDLVAAAVRLALGLPVRDTPRFDGVAYQYALLPRAGPSGGADGRVGAAELERLRALPGVDLVDPRPGAGSAASWREGAGARLGHLHGWTADHADLARLTRAIDDICRPVFGEM